MSDSQVFFGGGSINRSCASRRAAPGDTLREDPGISGSRSCRLQPLVSRCRNWWSCVWGQMLMELLLITRGVDEKLRKSRTLNNFHEMLWRKLRYVNLRPVTAAGSESPRMIEINPLSGQLFMNGMDPTPIKQEKHWYPTNISLGSRRKRSPPWPWSPCCRRVWLAAFFLLAMPELTHSSGQSSRWHRKCKKMLEHVTSKRLICSFMRGIAPNKIVRIWSLGLFFATFQRPFKNRYRRYESFGEWGAFQGCRLGV